MYASQHCVLYEAEAPPVIAVQLGTLGWMDAAPRQSQVEKQYFYVTALVLFISIYVFFYCTIFSVLNMPHSYK